MRAVSGKLLGGWRIGSGRICAGCEVSIFGCVHAGQAARKSNRRIFVAVLLRMTEPERVGDGFSCSESNPQAEEIAISIASYDFCF